MTCEIGSAYGDFAVREARVQAVSDVPQVSAPPNARADRFADLAERIGRGDQKALAELFDATGSRLYSAAFHILADAATAEEVVSDVYFQFWSDIQRYDPSRSSVQVWLLVLCRSRALDARRRMRDEGRSRYVGDDELKAFADDSGDPPDLLAAMEEGNAVHAELARLGARERQLIALAFFRGCTHREIAEREGLPLGTVKSHIRQALLHLRGALQAAKLCS